MKRVEQELQVAVIKHLRARGKRGLLYWHTPQGAHYSSRAQGKIMKGLGTLAGVSDLLLFFASKFYALELKAPGEKPTSDQIAYMVAVHANGGYVECADSLDAAVAQLEDWGLLQGRIQI